MDFDDTLVTANIARQVFQRFAGPTWPALEASYVFGSMTVEEYCIAAVDLLEAQRQDIREFARSVATPRPGAIELVDWSRWHGWQPVVLSNGFDLYLDPVLEAMGFEGVARHCGRARFVYRWRLRYLSPRGVELQEGFKVSYASAFLQAGDFVAYVGDGASDVEAAKLAPAVFARDTLLARLEGNHPRLHPFDTLHDVRAVLDREAEGWLAARATDG